MMDLTYLVDAKTLFISDEDRWDYFFSALNDSERVRHTFNKVQSENKYWVVIPEYQYDPADLPRDANVLRTESFNEADQIIETIGSILSAVDRAARICIDITGFMRPQILFILKYLEVSEFLFFDMIYTEPRNYSRKGETEFTLSDVTEVRQVSGFEGSHNLDMSKEMPKDVLFIGVGYDSNLMARVALDKDRARQLQLHSLPSLSADMYQESLIRLDRAGLPNNSGDDQIFFSSASDPYLTASALSSAHSRIFRTEPISNLYLSPLATKPQALGFGLFYLKELIGTPSSIIFPFSTKYSRETSEGVGRTWRYPICLS
jgi:hypothetical protein